MDEKELLKYCEVETITVSGPGGQNRNRTYSGIRITHLPTGLVVKATERSSQSANKKIALMRLKEKLRKHFYKPKKRVATKPTRASNEERLKEKSKRANKKASRRGWE